MYLGYNTNGFAHHRLDDALTILAELGYRGVALTLDHNTLDPSAPGLFERAEQLRALLERLNLKCVIETGARFLLDPRRKHQPTLLGPTAEERAARFDFLAAAVQVARLLGAEVVSFWSGAPTDAAGVEVLWGRLVDGCKRLCDTAAAAGVLLAFEPEPGMFVDTMARFAVLHWRVSHPALGLTLDVGHLHCQGEGPVARHVQRWADRLWNVHIEDMKRGTHDHLPFGEGEMDIPAVIAALRAADYQGGAFVELSRHSHDAVETARKSLTYLRQVGGVG
jgi:L-ribulose-5-phosphate 3-epimerase